MQCLSESPLAMAVLNLLNSTRFTEHLESPWHSVGCWDIQIEDPELLKSRSSGGKTNPVQGPQ